MRNGNDLIGRVFPGDGIPERLTGGRLLVESGAIFATKIMANGVEVIIKGNQGSPLIGKNEVIAPLAKEKMATTLPPTTVSNQFHLIDHPNRPNTAIDHLLQSLARSASPEFLTRTMMTTFTYFHTILQNNSTVVSTSEETFSNVVTEFSFPEPTASPLNELEMTSPGSGSSTLLDASPSIFLPESDQPTKDLPELTHYSTFTFLKTLYDFEGPHVQTQYETLTEVVRETSASIQSVLPPSPLIRTFFTTFTTFLTSLDGFSPVISTQTSVTSNVITSPPTLIHDSLVSSPAPQTFLDEPEVEEIRFQPVMIYATKTFYTTTTFLTSILGKGNQTQVSSSTSVVSNVVTEVISTVVNGDYLLALQSSFLAEHPETTDSSTSSIELTTYSELEIRTIEGTYVPDSSSEIFPHWPKDEDLGIMDPIPVLHATPTLQEPNLQEWNSEINHLIHDLVAETSEDLISPTKVKEEVYATASPGGSIYSIQSPTPPLEVSVLSSASGDQVSIESIQTLSKETQSTNASPSVVIGYFHEGEQGVDRFPGQSGKLPQKGQTPDYYDEFKAETAFKEEASEDTSTLNSNQAHQFLERNETEEEPTTEVSLETLQQEILDEIPTVESPSSAFTEEVALKFKPDAKPEKVNGLGGSQKFGRRPTKPSLPPDYDDEEEPLGNIYNLILPKPPIFGSDSEDLEALSGQDDEETDDEETEEQDDSTEKQRRPPFQPVVSSESNSVFNSPPPSPGVTPASTSGISWNPLLKFGALGLGGLGASALAKWSPLLAGYLKSGLLVPILARNDTQTHPHSHEGMNYPKYPHWTENKNYGAHNEESFTIPRRPVLSHANEPNFRFENSPNWPSHRNKIPNPMNNMQVVLTPLGNGHHSLPSSNIVKVVAGKPVNAIPNHRNRVQMKEQRPIMAPPRQQQSQRVNHVILPFPPTDSNEVEGPFNHEMASEEIIHMRPPPQYSRPAPAQGNFPGNQTPRPNYQNHAQLHQNFRNQLQKHQNLQNELQKQQNLQNELQKQQNLRNQIEKQHLRNQIQKQQQKQQHLQNQLQLQQNSQHYLQQQQNLGNQLHQKQRRPEGTLLTPKPQHSRPAQPPSTVLKQRPSTAQNQNNNRPHRPSLSSNLNHFNSGLRRPANPIPTSLTNEETRLEGHKKITKIPTNQKRPIPSTNSPATQLRPRPSQNSRIPPAFNTKSQGKPQNFPKGQQISKPFSNGGPWSFEFIPTSESRRPFTATNQNKRPWTSGEGEGSRPIKSRPFSPNLSAMQNQGDVQASWEEPDGFFLNMMKLGGDQNPFNPKYRKRPTQTHFIRDSSEENHNPGNPNLRFRPNSPTVVPRPHQSLFVPFNSNPAHRFPIIGLSSEEIMSVPPLRGPPRPRPQNQHHQNQIQEQSHDEFQVRPLNSFRKPEPNSHTRPVQSHNSVPQRYPMGQGLYEMTPQPRPPTVLLPATKFPSVSPPTLNPAVLLPAWHSEQSLRIKPSHASAFSPYNLRPSTVFIVEETYDPPPTKTESHLQRPFSNLPDTQHQLIIKEIKKNESASPTLMRTSTIPTTERPFSTTRRRPTFMRRRTTTARPTTTTSSTPRPSKVSFEHFPEGFQFSSNIQQIFDTETQNPVIRKENEVSPTLGHGEEVGGSTNVFVATKPPVNGTRPSFMEIEEEMTASEEEALMKAFASSTNGDLSSTPRDFWWETTFRPIPEDPQPTTFRNEMKPTTFRNSMRATTFRPRRPLLSNAPNHIVRRPWNPHENEGLDQVKLKNVEIHKTPGTSKNNSSPPSGPVLAFLPVSDEYEEFEEQDSLNEGDNGFGTNSEEYSYEQPPGFPPSRLRPPPPPPPRNGESLKSKRPMPNRPLPPHLPRPKPFEPFTNIFRRPFKPLSPNPPRSPPPNGKRVPTPPPRWQISKPAPPNQREKIHDLRKRPLIIRRPIKPPTNENSPPDYAIGSNFHKVKPIPLNPAAANRKPPPRFRLTSTKAPPSSTKAQIESLESDYGSYLEENEVEAEKAGTISKPKDSKPLHKKPIDSLPAADGDSFYTLEEEEDSSQEPIGNRQVGGHLNSNKPLAVNTSLDEGVPKPDLEPPPIDNSRLKPAIMELPHHGPVRIKPKPNLLRPDEKVLRPAPQKPTFHTIATVDKENKIIGTNIIPVLLPSRTTIQPTRTRERDEAKNQMTLIGSVEEVDLNPRPSEQESHDRPSIVKYTNGRVTKVDTTYQQTATTQIRNQIKPSRTFTRGTPKPSTIPSTTERTTTRFRIRTRPTTPPPTPKVVSSLATRKPNLRERESIFSRPKPGVKTPPPYKPRKPFMPIRNPEESSSAGPIIPWRRRVTTAVPSTTSSRVPTTPKFKAIHRFTRPSTRNPKPKTPNFRSTTETVPVSSQTPFLIDSTTITPSPTPKRHEISSWEEELDEAEAIITPTTFRPANRSQYYSTPSPRDNLTTTLITKHGDVVVVNVKKISVSTASSVSTRLPSRKTTTRFVTRTESVTQTFMETETMILPSSVKGVEPVTQTVIKTKLVPPETKVSTILGSVTLVNTLPIRPTTVRTTIFSKPTQTVVTLRPSEVTTQKPRTSTPNLPDVIQETKILKGGGGIFFRKPFPEVTAPTPIITRKPEKKEKTNSKSSFGRSGCSKFNCSIHGNQICKGNGTDSKCVCKPGYARLRTTYPCRPTFTFELSVGMKPMGNGLEFMKEGTEARHEFLEGTREALQQAFMATDISRQFQGTEVMKVNPKTPVVYVDFLVQLTANMSEDRVRKHLLQTLRNSNFTVGKIGVLTPETSRDLSAKDFNECAHPEFHDCSPNAKCINLRGSFTCECREGFKDRKRRRPGRDCRSLAGCADCNYKGNCYRDKYGNKSCDCFRWFGGADCRWNLKILLLGVIGVGTLLFVLVIVCGVVICRRQTRVPSRQRVGSGRFMRYRSPTSQATLERTAIMHDTASSSGRSDETQIQPMRHPAYTPDSLVEANSGKTHSNRNQNSNLINFSLRNVGADHDVSPMSVVIPRAKIRLNPNPQPGPSGSGPQQEAEKKLIKYLEPGPSKPSQQSSLQREQESKAFRKLSLQERRISSGALVSSGTEVSARGGMRRRSTGLEPEFPARVYDKTLSDIRSSRASCYSCKPPSYYSESGGHTMAEKDGASTVYTVQGKLFRLANDTDSNMSSD